MRSLYATSLMVLSADAAKLNPDANQVSPDYTDWFEHPTYMDAHYADYYGRDTSNAVNAAEVAGVDYLVKDPKQYWVENWYKDSSMPIKPAVKWDNPAGLSSAEKAWRNNKWVDDAATPTNENKNWGLLKGEYQNLLRKLADIEVNNVENKNRKYAATAQKLKLLLATMEELNEDEEQHEEEEQDEENVQVDEEDFE